MKMNSGLYVLLGFSLIIVLVASGTTLISSDVFSAQIIAVVIVLISLLALIRFWLAFDEYLKGLCLQKNIERVKALHEKAYRGCEIIGNDFEFKKILALDLKITNLATEHYCGGKQSLLSLEMSLKEIESQLALTIKIQVILIKAKELLNFIQVKYRECVRGKNAHHQAYIKIEYEYYRITNVFPCIAYASNRHKVNDYETALTKIIRELDSVKHVK